MNSFRTASRIGLFLVVLASHTAAFATEPLIDQIKVGDQVGIIFPAQCCWVPMPKTERWLKAKREERCSAVGGPVGEFKLAEGKLWLTGLRRCAGAMPIQEIYPEFNGPAVAHWVSGSFKVKLDWMCKSLAGPFIYKREMMLEIDQGLVAVVSESTFDDTGCLR